MIVNNGNLDIAQNSLDAFRVYTWQRFNKLYMNASYIYIYIYIVAESHEFQLHKRYSLDYAVTTIYQKYSSKLRIEPIASYFNPISSNLAGIRKQ